MNRNCGKLLLMALLVVGLAWIWLNRVPGDSTAEEGNLPPAPAVGHPAPDISLTTLAGGQFRLSALRGTPVVLNFWATWCPPCRAELPELQAAHERLVGQVAVVGVNQGEAPAEVTEFASRYGLTFPLPMDTSGEASRPYRLRAFPTTFFIDRAGIIRQIQVGPVTEATLAQLLRSIYP